MSHNKGFGEILLVIGIASLLIGIGVIYSETFSSSIAHAGNNIPAWFGSVIAVTFTILGIVLIVLGTKELSFHYGTLISRNVMERAVFSNGRQSFRVFAVLRI